MMLLILTGCKNNPRRFSVPDSHRELISKIDNCGLNGAGSEKQEVDEFYELIGGKSFDWNQVSSFLKFEENMIINLEDEGFQENPKGPFDQVILFEVS